MQLPTPIREGREVSVEAWLKQRDTLPVLPSLVPDTPPGPSSTARDPAPHLTTGPVLMSASSSSLLSSLPSLPQSLPPSLVPPTMESLLGVEFAKWGWWVFFLCPKFSFHSLCYDQTEKVCMEAEVIYTNNINGFNLVWAAFFICCFCYYLDSERETTMYW